MDDLVDFGNGVALGIIPAEGGRWRIAEGRRRVGTGSSTADTQIVPPLKLELREFDSRAEAIAAALEWVKAQKW